MSSSKRDIYKFVQDLLLKLKKQNDENDCEGFLTQRIHPAVLVEKGIPTLEKGVFRRVSPMLKARFDFCGGWENAHVAMTWLDPVSMETASNEKRVCEQIKIRRENWEDAFEFPPDNRLSLFAIDLVEYDEVYLAWIEHDEPKVVAFVQNNLKVYTNFCEYLVFLTT